MKGSRDQVCQGFNFPQAERKEFPKNFLDTVVIELRFPTLLRLKETEPTFISESIRNRFPRYESGKEMQMTPLGTTDPEPVYRFATKNRDPIVTMSASNLALTTKQYRSFSDFSSHIDFLLEKVVPSLDTTFFTRVGLRYINHIFWDCQGETDIRSWINEDLIRPLATTAIGALENLKSELSGPLPDRGNYTFRYALPRPGEQGPNFVLDWDYYVEDIEVADCREILQDFHDLHFPFFWWALGERAREALNNGDVRKK